MAAAKLLQYKMDTNKIPKRPAIEKAEATLAKGWYSCGALSQLQRAASSSWLHGAAAAAAGRIDDLVHRAFFFRLPLVRAVACEPLADGMGGKTAIASRRMRESFKLRSKKKIPKFPQGISLELGYDIGQKYFLLIIKSRHLLYYQRCSSQPEGN